MGKGKGLRLKDWGGFGLGFVWFGLVFGILLGFYWDFIGIFGLVWVAVDRSFLDSSFTICWKKNKQVKKTQKTKLKSGMYLYDPT